MNESPRLRSSSRGKAVLLAALTLLGIALAFFLGKQSTEKVAATVAPASLDENPGLAVQRPSDSIIDAAPAAPAPVLAPSQSSPAATAALLPDASLPFAEQLDALVDAARAGNPTAGCRLAVSSARCKALENQLDRMGDVSKGDGPYANSPEAVDYVDARTEGMSRTARYCRDIDPSRLPAMDEILGTSLASMSLRQRVLLAALRFDGTLRQLPRGTQGFSVSGHEQTSQVLADHALDWLRDGAMAGDPLAIENLLLISTPALLGAPNFDRWFALPNPRQFAALALQYRERFGADALGPPANQTLETALAAMTPAEREQLEAQAQIAAQRWQAQDQALGDPHEARAARTIEDLCSPE